MTADEWLCWTGAGKWHAPHHDHAACSPQILLLLGERRLRSTVPVTDQCGRCFPGSVARRRLKLVR